MKDTSGSGVVLASFGRGVLVKPDVGETPLHCSLKSRKLRLICGDRVGWVYQAAHDGPTVESIEPRRNQVERIDLRGRAEPVAANIDCVAVVVAPQPAPDWFLVDRYWAGAQLKDMATLLLVNKIDLDTAPIRSEIDNYRSLGLRCAEVSTRAVAGLDELTADLAGTVSLLVGQSGVGKSSLVNALAPGAAALTAELTRDAEGRHTTTTARRYDLGVGTAIVDAPGVRDFAPPASLVRAAERGFVEVLQFSAACRFNDCRHLEEPGCAVRAAVPERISPRRYESYRRLLRLYEKLAPLQ